MNSNPLDKLINNALTGSSTPSTSLRPSHNHSQAEQSNYAEPSNRAEQSNITDAGEELDLNTLIGLFEEELNQETKLYYFTLITNRHAPDTFGSSGLYQADQTSIDVFLNTLLDDETYPLFQILAAKQLLTRAAHAKAKSLITHYCDFQHSDSGSIEITALAQSIRITLEPVYLEHIVDILGEGNAPLHNLHAYALCLESNKETIALLLEAAKFYIYKSPIHLASDDKLYFYLGILQSYDFNLDKVLIKQRIIESESIHDLVLKDIFSSLLA